MAATTSSCPTRKRRLGAVLGIAGITSMTTSFERRNPALRVVNCHSVPRRFARAFADQVEWLSRSWSFASPAELDEILEHGPSRATLMFCFDDGLANTIENAAPILEAAGTRAIFAVPAAWPDVEQGDQPAWFRERVYPRPTELHAFEEDQQATTWEALRLAISRGHEVWSHGADHVRLTDDLSAETLEREIVGSRHTLESKLGAVVRGYCPPMSHDVPRTALELIRRTYDLAFGGMPRAVSIGGDRHRIPRSNIEASWPTSVVAMQLSPIGDATTAILDRIRS